MDNMNNMARMRDLRDTVNEIEQRADSTISYDKLHEYKDGLDEIEEQYGDTYKAEVIDNLIADYEQDKTQAIKQELGAFDEYSQSLVSKANNYVKRLEADLKTSADPTTQFELDKHNYILNKFRNELTTAFTSGNADISELNDTINQAQYNKLYANAFLQVQGMLEQNIQNNSNIDLQQQQSLLTQLREQMNAIKKFVLPSEYYELTNIKERLNANELSARNKAHDYDFLSNFNDNMREYKQRKALSN